MGQSGITTKNVSFYSALHHDCFYYHVSYSYHICSEAFLERILRIALYPLPVREFDYSIVLSRQ